MKVVLVGIELVIFDWSGTVSDDRIPVYEANKKLLKTFNKDIPSFENWLTLTTANAPDFLKTQGVIENKKILWKMYEDCLTEVVMNGINPTIYPDAFEVFQYLFTKGKKLVILSSHPEKHLLKEANFYNLSQFITLIVADSDDKSNELVNICQKFDVKPESVLFVGDTTFDIQAAKKVGVISAAVTTGYHSKELLSEENPDFIFSRLSDLKSVI